MASLSEIYTRHGRYQDAITAAFEHQLQEIVSRAQMRVTVVLQQRLVITEGVIEQTAGNLKVLRGINKLFMAEMEAAGLQHLLEAFAGQLHGQLPYMQEVLGYLSDQMETPLPGLDAPVPFTAKDRGILASFQANTVAALETVMETAAAAAMTRGMFSIGGLKFGDLVESLAARFDQSIARARTLADTAQSTFYRTATDRAFRIIEQGAAPKSIKYRYSGPSDKLERPFCRHLTDADKGYTREQISKMDNGQMPSVWLTGGGWNCRHSWILDTRELEVRAMEAA